MAEQMSFNDYCEAFAKGYFSSDPECRNCDEASRCSELTKGMMKVKRQNRKGGVKMLTQKLADKILKKAKDCDEVSELVELIEEYDLEVEVKKKDELDDVLKKIKAAVKAATEDDDDDKKDKGGDDDDDDKKGKKTKKDKDDDDDKGEATLEELEARVKSLETRIAEIQEKLASGGGTKGSKKEEKAAKKAKLLEGVPYGKEDLENMNARDLKMLASALGVNPFGKSVVDVKKMVVKAQEKAGKKGKKKDDDDE
jgi:hypothetical protein